MAIHIELVDRHGTAPYKGENKMVVVANLRFEEVNDALEWWRRLSEISHLRDKDVEEVIKATATEYVGTEHELMTTEGDYTSLILCIEGQVGEKTFDARFKDMIIHEIVNLGNSQFTLNGKDLAGRHVWQSVVLHPNCTMRKGNLPSITSSMPPNADAR